MKQSEDITTLASATHPHLLRQSSAFPTVAIRGEPTLDRLCVLGAPDDADARNLLDMVLFWPLNVGSRSWGSWPCISDLYAFATVWTRLVAIVGHVGAGCPRQSLGIT
jgi:hypothetical protein